MIARVLPRNEWPRLRNAGVPYFDHWLLPDQAEVVVVEDGPRIVARMYVMRLPHYEGAWVDPEYRGNLGVTRALLRESANQAKRWSHGVVLGGVVDDHMRDVMKRLGAERLDADFYVLPVGARE